MFTSMATSSMRGDFGRSKSNERKTGGSRQVDKKDSFNPEKHAKSNITRRSDDVVSGSNGSVNGKLGASQNLSPSGSGIAFNGNNNATGKRVPRQLPSLTQENQQEGEQSLGSTKGRDPKKRRRDKKKNAAVSKNKEIRSKSTVMDQLESLGVKITDIQDDIVDPSSDPESINEGNMQNNQHFLRSQPIGKIFVEQSNGFRAKLDQLPFLSQLKTMEPPPVEFLKEHLNLLGGFKVTDKINPEPVLEKKTDDYDKEMLQPFPITISSMAFALQTIHVNKTFAHFCMGILTGLAIWQALFAYTLTDMKDQRVFSEYYNSISVPINCVFYIILIIASVSCFDRYDMAMFKKQFISQNMKLQSGAVVAVLACVLYMTALCINVSIAPMDDRLGPFINSTTDSSREFTDGNERDGFIATWRLLNLFRAIFITLAWFVVSLYPSTDKLSDNLSNSEESWQTQT